MNKKRIIIGSRQRINTNNVDTNSAAQALIPYIEAGITHFDTADHYADGEEILGILKQTYGDHVTVGTKRCPAPMSVQPGEVRKAIETSLHKLKSDCIDLLQFHDWDPKNKYGVERLIQLTALQKEGLIKKIGMTNANTSYLQKLVEVGIPVTSNQICYSLLATRPDSRMLNFCKKHTIELLAFGTVGGGFFSEKRLQTKEPKIDDLSNASLKKYKRFIDIIGGREHFQKIGDLLATIAKKHSVSVATVASNMIIHQPSVGAVIIGARLGESAHIQENKKVLSLELTDTEREMIQNLLDQSSLLPGDFGDEYRVSHTDCKGGHAFLTSTGKAGYSGHQTDFIK